MSLLADLLLDALADTRSASQSKPQSESSSDAADDHIVWIRLRVDNKILSQLPMIVLNPRHRNSPLELLIADMRERRQLLGRAGKEALQLGELFDTTEFLHDVRIFIFPKELLAPLRPSANAHVVRIALDWAIRAVHGSDSNIS